MTERQLMEQKLRNYIRGREGGASMGSCNGCGDCCNPVTMPEERLTYILNWADQPDPSDAPELYTERGFDVTDEAQMAQARTHIANGKFAKEHWLPNIVGVEQDTKQVIISCPHFDPLSGECHAYELRPPICSGYPWYGKEVTQALEEHGRPTDRCSYWEDVPVTLRPKGWKLLAQGEARPDTTTAISLRIAPRKVTAE